jgi:uncharacterized protein (TIGR01777 family)
MKQKVILAGGSGFVGNALTPLLLSAGYDVIVLSRHPSARETSVQEVEWDGKTLGSWARSLEGAAAVVNLSGRSINCRHTPKNRRLIVESRVDSVRVLGQAIAQLAHPPAAFVQAAGIGIYGDAGDRWCDENAPHGKDFVAHVCERWETAFAEVVAPHTRKVLLRLGVVLGRDGGFLKVLSRLTRLFLGGQIGDGEQFISWIHMADLAHMFRVAIEMPEITGIYNATSPNPVSNADFMRELRFALHRPWSPPVPRFAARLGSWLMGTEASLAFVSQRGVPRHFLEQDLDFKFPELRPALHDLLPS